MTDAPSRTSRSMATYTTTILKPSELAKSPQLLAELKEIVNQAYKDTHDKLERDSNVEINSIFPGLRLRSDDQLVQELPEDSSLIALLFDNEYSTPTTSPQSNQSDLNSAQASSNGSKSNGQSEDGKKLVAVASLKRWKGTVLKKHYQSLSSNSLPFPNGPQYPPQSILSEKSSTDPDPTNYWDWEIATCACINSEKYRGKGLVSQLTSILLNELQLQRDEHFQNMKTEGSKALPIRLWVSALGGSYNVQYWTKRGYTVQGSADTAPPGVWGNAVDIQIWTLSKVIE